MRINKLACFMIDGPIRSLSAFYWSSNKNNMFVECFALCVLPEGSICKCDWLCAQVVVVGTPYELIWFFMWIEKTFNPVCEHLWSYLLSTTFVVSFSELETQANLQISFFHCFLLAFLPYFWLYFSKNCWKSRDSYSQNNCCIACLRKKNFEWNLCFYLIQINPPYSKNEFRTHKVKTWKNLCSFRLFSIFLPDSE